MFRWMRRPGEDDESPQRDRAGDGGSDRTPDPEDGERRGDKVQLLIEGLKFATALVRAFGD
ncbi:hypothetical protein [Kitasatospora aureofaciens]|uniref:hypothetical protein n=1 Tax=Kitasatospora aureofaciens TaxID=1894 RepID=UPI001C45376D|nr:hypothetical protein [Kitasatospora aureofaciens]MBV6695510.1 hypothetical protein [Kitasatospora aureofaciens]